MLNIVKSLLFRLKKSKMFWIMLGICALLPVLTLLLCLTLIEIVKIFIEFPSDLGLSVTTHSMLTALASPSSTVNFLALLCVSIFLCKEFTDGTVRNALLSNKSRIELYSAYCLTALIIGGSFLVANFVSTLLALGIPFGFGDITFGQGLSSCLCSLLLGILSLVFVVSCVLMFMFATGKQSSSIVLPLLVVIFLPQIVTSVVDLISGLIYTIQMLEQYGSVDIPFEFTMDESWIPLYNSYLYDSTAVEGALVGKISLYYVLFGALFTFLGGLASVKRDLK